MEEVLYDNFYMEARREALLALSKDEVPVGCVVVKDGKIIGRGHNMTETAADPSAHAEVIAIREAAKALGSWRLTGTTLYVTLEPCLMCASLIKKSRIGKVVIGAIEPEEGAFGSTASISLLPPRGRQIEVVWLRDELSGDLMTSYFKKLRSRR
jgi:tRNA(adenine34) deaminase